MVGPFFEVWAERCVRSVLSLLRPGPGSAHELQQLCPDFASGRGQCIPNHLGPGQQHGEPSSATLTKRKHGHRHLLCFYMLYYTLLYVKG